MDPYGRKAERRGAAEQEPQRPSRDIKEKHVAELDYRPRNDELGHQAGATDVVVQQLWLRSFRFRLGCQCRYEI